MMNNDKVRVIESNSLIAEKLQLLKQSKLSKDNFNDKTSEESLGNEPMFTEGFESPKVELISEKETLQQDLLEEAQEEINMLKENAYNEIETMRKEAVKSGKDQGFKEGMEKAEQYLSEQKANNEILFQQQQRESRTYYENKIEEIEPLLIDILSDVYEYIFQVDFKSKKELILYLIGNTLRGIEGGRDFLVHISREDYSFVVSKRETLLTGLTANTTVEYIEDATLSQAECFIEAEGGIYDCSLDTQLEELKKQLKLLSYTR